MFDEKQDTVKETRRYIESITNLRNGFFEDTALLLHALYNNKFRTFLVEFFYSYIGTLLAFESDY